MRRVLLVIALLCAPAFGVTHYVWCGATGAATGNDFTNALTNVPTGTSPVRGDTYVVAGSATCTYASRDWSTANSGTSVITIRHALAASDSGVAGWTASFGTAQAKWVTTPPTNIWVIRTSHWHFDGTSDTAGQQGFLLDQDLTLAANQFSAFIFIGHGDATQTDLDFTYIEINGHSCCSISNTTLGTEATAITSGTTYTTLGYHHVYFHDITGGPFDVGGSTDGLTIDHSHIARNRSSSANHSEGISAKPVLTLDDHDNIWENIKGTGVWVCLTGTCGPWTIYNDVVVNYDGVAPCSIYDGSTEATCGHGSGILVTNTAGGGINGLKFYGNSIINVDGGSNCGVKAITGTTATNWDVRNNIWYNCGSSTIGITETGGATCSASCTHDYNNFWNVTVESGTTKETHEENITSGKADPFTSVSTENFTLTANTTAGDTTTCATSPFSVDAAGNTRTTCTRGAFEFSGTPSPSISISPTTHDFGSVAVGSSSAAFNFTISNNGGASATISSVSVGTADFSVTTTPTTNCGGSIAASGSCTAHVTFSPSGTGSKTDTLSVSDSAVGSPHTASLSGTGGTSPVAVDSISPSSITCNATAVGSACSSTFTLTNSGAATANISSITVTSTMTLTSTCGATLAASANCVITVYPANKGTFNATVTVTDDGGSPTATVSGSGNASAARQGSKVRGGGGIR